MADQPANGGQLFNLSSGTDTFTGDDGGRDVFRGSANQSRNDELDGRGGVDTLQITNENASFATDLMSAMTSIERVDFIGGGALTVVADAIGVGQATGDLLTLVFGDSTVSLRTNQVGDAGGVALEGTGLVTLRNSENQRVEISDAVGGNVLGGVLADTIVGGASADSIRGGEGDDSIVGGGGADTLSGDEGSDIVVGGEGPATLRGGDGVDLLILGSQNAATGGDGFDAFRIGETVSEAVIEDFDATDPLERIDLSLHADATAFSDLAITQQGADARVAFGGHVVIVRGVAASALGPRSFAFFGEETAAGRLTTRAIARLGGDADSVVGGDGDDVVEMLGSIANLSGADTIAGGGGTDTLRIVTGELSLAPERLAGLSSVERLDLTGSTETDAGFISLALDDATVAQAGGAFTVIAGTNDLLLDVQAVDDARTVVLETFGLVTLRNFDGQAVVVSDAVDGRVAGGTGADSVTGGDGDDTLTGAEADDTLLGGGGDDNLAGGDEDDSLVGGAGDDTLAGDVGNDVLAGGAGANRLTGGANADRFVIDADTGRTTITDFDAASLVERIDLTGFDDVSGFEDLSISDGAGGAEIDLGEHVVALSGVSAAALGAGDFLFAGQDPLIFDAPSTTRQDALQELLDEAPDGARIRLGAGDFVLSETLTIGRSDITVSGEGEGVTRLLSTIPNERAGQVLNIESDDLRIEVARLAADAGRGDRTVTLTDASAYAPGDLIYLALPNDDAFLRATNNEGLIFPEAADEFPQNFVLREALLGVVSVDGNTVTLSNPLPFDMRAGDTSAQRSDPLRNVVVEDFTLDGGFGDILDPLDFSNPLEDWNSVSALAFDNVTESVIRNVTVQNVASHGILFQRVFDVEGADLTVLGAVNKGEQGNGYGVYLQEAFEVSLTGVVSNDVRHSVLTSSFDAEHYNSVTVESANRDINFHGGPDTDNTILVQRMALTFPDDPQFPAVGPGSFPIHPRSTIDENDVTFEFLRGAVVDEDVAAAATGGDIDTGRGEDRVRGGAGADTLNGGADIDTLSGGGGADLFVGRPGDLNGDRIEDLDPNDSILVKGAVFGDRDVSFSVNGSGEGLLSIDADSDGDEDIRLTLANVAAGTIFSTSAEGRDTRITVTGAPSDGERPELLGLAIPDAVDLSGGATEVAFGASARDNLALGRVILTFAEPLSTSSGRSRDVVIDADGAAEGAFSQTVTLLRSTSSGPNALTNVVVEDLAGNRLSLDAAALAERGLGETLSISGGGVAEGGDGDDVIDTGGGDDSIDGGGGNDSLVSGDGDDTVSGGDGDDTIKTGDGEDRVNGDDGDDVILSGNDDDVIRGGAGNDNIKPGRGNDTVIGGDGDDIVAGFRGDERFEGGEGNDRLLGSVDDDTLIGGSGDDRLWGGPGFDVFIFEQRDFGRDTLPLDVRIGSDTLDFRAVVGLTQSDFTIRQVGSNVVLEVADGGTLIMNGVRFGGLDADEMIDRFDEFILL